MQKSRNATITIIIIIFLYSIFIHLNWIKQYNTMYLYVINPVFWILLAFILKYGIGEIYENKKNRKKIIEYCFIGVLIYIITYMLSGLFVTFGENPYSTTIHGIIMNLWILGTPIVIREYIRYMLIQNVYNKDKIKVAVAISIVYILIDFDVSKFLYETITMLYIIKQISQNLIPLIAKNLLYSYVSLKSHYTPSIIYEIGTKLYLWVSPILPNVSWIMIAFIDGVIPIIIYIYIRYENTLKDVFKSRDKINATNPRNTIPLIIGIIGAIWFAVGIFPIKPIAIASGSMEKELCVGDVAIIKKCKSNDIIEGDIVEYQMDGYTVVHRVIEKKQKNGQFYFTTKGDNNKLPDEEKVKEEQIIGKVIFKIKYIGYPAVWLNLKEKENINIKVET